MKVVRFPYTGGTWYQRETYDAEISQYQSDDSIDYVFITGGNSRKSQVHVKIQKDDFEFIIGRMLEIDPTSTCNAFNKAVKKQLRKLKSENSK